jgi:general secretion pathway protein E/type IV pilus assembly protein PilB
MSISEELLKRGLITPADLGKAVELHKAEGLRLDRALVRLGHVDERQLLEITGEQLSLPVLDLTNIKIDEDVLRLLPSRFVYRKKLLPIGHVNGSLRVATSDAYDLYAFDEIRLMTGLTVEPVLAPGDEIDKVIKTHYGVGGDTVDEMVKTDGIDLIVGGGEDTQDLLEMAQEASVIKLVNEIILEAINEDASDIHIEPYEHELSIRYRLDGVLHAASVPPQIRRFQSAIISRIKILADMNIAEKRLPQDGRIKFAVGTRQVDVRVSVIPMIFGEGVVMRILDKSSVLYTLQELGMARKTHNRFETLIDRPHGIILVTGPTGSGKTTTLYAALNAIVGPERKVLTVEDPVEYNLDGVNQIPVAHKIGMTFERGLRAILRHDPDVIMIGEIRDLETARAATQAALTGHLVLSTLHTNDAASAATRLVDMGVESFLVSSTVVGCMAQRLVRKICSECREEFQPPREDLPPDFPRETLGKQKLYHGAGCRNCRDTGYRGRSGIYELLTVSEAVAEKIMERAPTNEIVRAAREGGLTLLREDGWLKVSEGMTTPEEVVRCTAV